MGYEHVEMFTKVDLERHASSEVERALKADRKIQKYAARQKFWTHFEWTGFFCLLVFIAVLTAGTILWSTHLSQPAREVPDEFRVINNSCFTVNGDQYCAHIERDTTR